MARLRSKALNPVEAAIMDVVWKNGAVTAALVTEQLPGGRHYNTVLSILRILETKGYLKHAKDPDGRGFLYSAVVTRAAAEAEAVRELANRLFGGSTKALAVRVALTPARRAA